MPLFILLKFAEAAKIRVLCKPLLFVSYHKTRHLMDGKAELTSLIEFLRCSEEGYVDFGASVNEPGLQPLCMLCLWSPPGSPHISLPSDGNPGGKRDAGGNQHWQLLCKKPAPLPRIGRCQKLNTSLLACSPDHRSWSCVPTCSNFHVPGRPIGAVSEGSVGSMQ